MFPVAGCLQGLLFGTVYDVLSATHALLRLPSTLSLACCRLQDPARRFPLEDHVPVPSLKTQCGAGCGLAASPTLGLLVTSHYKCNTLSVWSLPDGPCAFGGAGSAAGAGAGSVCRAARRRQVMVTMNMD